MELDEFRASLDTWLDRHDAELRDGSPAATLDGQMAHLARGKRLTSERNVGEQRAEQEKHPEADRHACQGGDTRFDGGDDRDQDHAMRDRMAAGEPLPKDKPVQIKLKIGRHKPNDWVARVT